MDVIFALRSMQCRILDGLQCQGMMPPGAPTFLTVQIVPNGCFGS